MMSNHKANKDLFMMLVFITVMCLLAWTASKAAAADISLCRSTEVEWVRFELVGANALPVDSWYVAEGAGPDESGKFVLDALADGTVQIGIPDEIEGYIIIDGNSSTPICGEGWQPGAPSIPIEMVTDCAYVDIQDEYGNWHRVEVDGVPVLLHYGEALIGGSQTTDPAAYRAVATACY
jgi:hypothetical protein